ncbi:hypothetical protein B0H13DRAFT_2304100 [Mycena leptocephala]|nr:hypothetical protein B0H13DRAFT_2304100 [Mycena leptocephala]
MSDPPDTPPPPTTLASSEPRPAYNTSNLIEKLPVEASEAEANVTVRTRSRRQVSPLPAEAQVVTPPRTPQQTASPSRDTPPHRPAPQIRVLEKNVAAKASARFTNTAPDVTLEPGAPRAKAQGGDQGKRGGARKARNALGESPPRADRQEDLPASQSPSDYAVPAENAQKPKQGPGTAKKDKFNELRDGASSASCLDELAAVLKETVATMRLYSGAPTKACLGLLDDIQERLASHRDFPSENETKDTFSAVLSRSVAAPVKELTAQVDAQQRAIQRLTKSVEALRNAPLLAAVSPTLSPSPSYANAAASRPATKPKPAPLPNPSDERILIRFDGPLPPIVLSPYPDILVALNAHLAPRGLPTLVYTQKQSENSLFIVPRTKADVAILSDNWESWAPGILPGGRIAPVATHCFLQVDGIPFAGAGSLEDLKKEFEERNPELGQVVGLPTWVNKPPSEARVAAIVASGKKPPKAGSLFIRLLSRERVDRAVATGRVILAGTAPAVGRGFPHLRVVQCWGCLKFGHTRARCSLPAARCGGCGKDAHGIICADKPSCVNCSGVHRSDSLSCPSRKRIAEQLRQRAADICKTLDSQSQYSPCLVVDPLSPLTPALGLSSAFSILTTPPAPRLPEVLMGVYDFDILCLQEPWEKEINSFDHRGYFQITPQCDTRHRVSMYFKESSIPASSICPRHDLSSSPDLLVVELIWNRRKVYLVNLYNDCETRAGVQLLEAVLKQLGRRSEILLVMDSNSHHALWDSLTKTESRQEDFDLHDLLMSHPLTLVTPPTYLRTCHRATLSTWLGLGSDHLPITYELDLGVMRFSSNRFNPDKMDLDKFLAVLRHELDQPPINITTQEELDEARRHCAMPSSSPSTPPP